MSKSKLLPILVFALTIVLGIGILFQSYKISYNKTILPGIFQEAPDQEPTIVERGDETCTNTWCDNGTPDEGEDDYYDCSLHGDTEDPDCNCSCFLPGTKVITAQGEKNIEEVQVGDIVQSFDPETQQMVESKVIEPYTVVRDHYYVIKTASGHVVKTTDEHPFYVGFDENVQKTALEKAKAAITAQIIALQDKLHGIAADRQFPDKLQPGFKRVKDLTIGDVLYVKNGDKLVKDKITSIQKIYGQQQVYNLILENSPNTYFADGFAVHNKGGGDEPEYQSLAKVYCMDNAVGGACFGKSPCSIDAITVNMSGDYGTMTIIQGSKYWYSLYDHASTGFNWRIVEEKSNKTNASWDDNNFSDKPGEPCYNISADQCTFDAYTVYPFEVGDYTQALFVTRGDYFWWYRYKPGQWEESPPQQGKLSEYYDGNPKLFVNNNGPCASGSCYFDSMTMYKNTASEKTATNILVTKGNRYWYYRWNGSKWVYNTQGAISSHPVFSTAGLTSIDALSQYYFPATGSWAIYAASGDKYYWWNNNAGGQAPNQKGNLSDYAPFTDFTGTKYPMPGVTVNFNNDSVETKTSDTEPNVAIAGYISETSWPSIEHDPSSLPNLSISNGTRYIDMTFVKKLYTEDNSGNNQAEFIYTNCSVTPPASPSPSPQESYQCVDLSTDNSSPQRGDTLTYTCTGETTNTTIATADFRVLFEGTELTQFHQTGIAITNNQATYDFTIPTDATAGSYLVECRVCRTTDDCTSWGQAQ